MKKNEFKDGDGERRIQTNIALSKTSRDKIEDIAWALAANDGAGKPLSRSEAVTRMITAYHATLQGRGLLAGGESGSGEPAAEDPS